MLRRFTFGSVLALTALVGFTPTSAAKSPVVAEVLGVQSIHSADIVLINQGYNAGLRQGMVCRLSRDGSEIAEVLLVELRPSCGAALIIKVGASESIHRGDAATIKVLKS